MRIGTCILTIAIPCIYAAPVNAQALEGDIYLRTLSGDIRRAAAVVVRIVPSDSVRAIQARHCILARFVNDSAASLIRSADSLMRVALAPGNGTTALTDYTAAQTAGNLARANRDAVVVNAAKLIHQQMRSSAVAEAKTDINAHYRFDSTPRGRFILWAEMTLGETFYQWLTPVDLPTARADMDNESVGANKLYCGLSVSAASIR